MRLDRMISLAVLGAALATTAATVAQAQGVSATAKSEPKAVKAKGHHMPAKATAKCGDGSWSTAASQQGACSSHGGVATWFGKKPSDATARCTDGSYYENAELQGACSGHGGVALRYKKSGAAGAKHKG